LVIISEANLKKRNKFVSIRWKLISTYLLLVLIALIIINIFISNTIKKIYIEQKKSDTFAKANIVSNRVRYYLLSDRMNQPHIKETMQDYSEEIDSRIIIVNKENVVKGDSSNIYLNEIFKHDEIQKALNAENSYGIYNFKQSGYVMYTSVPIVIDDKVIGATLLSTSIDYIYDEVNHISNQLILISLTSIIVISFIGFIFAGVIFKPLSEFKRVIDEVAKGNLKEKVKIDSNDEFKELADAFNIMITGLDQVDTQRKDFVANVSHELKTPLSSIKVLSESLINQENYDADVYKEFLIDIDSEVDRLNNIVSDLLSLVDIDKEKLSINYRIIYLNSLLEKIVCRMKPLAEKKSIDLRLKLNEEVQAKLDSEKIQQAIMNIIDNAIKYTPEGGRIVVKLYEYEKVATIEIKDNGIGIPEENLKYVFERFYRVDKARSRSTGGTGLGLSIAWQIVTLHQGTIEVKSKVGKGSIFYIKLPTKV
jgi:signal transduction histidine kinase